MAINKKLIHFKKYSDFIGSSGTNGTTLPTNGYYHNIPENAIVFILDTKLIWTHGNLYDGSTFDPSNIEASILNILNNKVDKVNGKGLSTNDYTTAEKNKLAGIASGAEVNVQSDWNVTDTSSDAYIKNKPTIPAAVTSSTVSGWGFTKNAGTITGIKMNGASKGTSGVVDLGTVITEHQDISEKLDKTTAASTYLSKTDAASTYLGKTAKAASATTADSATKATQDGSGNVITSTYATKTELNNKLDINVASTTYQPKGEYASKQEILEEISDLNAILVDTEDADLDPIINDYITLSKLNSTLLLYITESELESKGYITADLVPNPDLSSYITKTESANIYLPKCIKINHGTNNTTFALTPNILHTWGTVTSLTLTLATPSDTTVYNEYMFEFVSGSTATTLSLPSTVKWVSTPNIETNKIYQCSIVNNVGIIAAANNV